MTQFLPLFLVIFGAATAFADQPTLQSFTYRVQAPQSASSCEQHAADIAARFAKGSTAQNVSGSCEGRTQVDTIIVSYQDTHIDNPALESFDGAFKSDSDCVGALARQQSLFEAQTGLTAIASYCEAADFSGYSLKIASFGKAQKSFSVFSASPLGADALVMQTIAASLAEAGSVVAYQNDDHVYYYSSSPTEVSINDLGQFANADQCAEQKSDALEIFTAGGMSDVSVLCDRSILTVVALGSGLVTTDFGYNSAQYTGLAECMGDKARAVKNIISSGGSPLGAICQPNIGGPENTYVIDYFYRSEY